MRALVTRAADAVRQERGAAALRRARARRRPAGGDGGRRDRARPELRRRVLRRRQDARHRRPERQGRRRARRGSRRSSRVLDARRARVRGVLHRRHRQPAHRPPADRAASAAGRSRGATTSSSSGSARSACACACCCASAGSASSPSTTARTGENVGKAREAGLPVVIGRGADPSLLRRLSLERAFALAAVTDDDLENVSIAHGRAVAARRTCASSCASATGAWRTRRARCSGSASCATCTASPRALIAAQATGSSASRVVCTEDEAHLVHDDGHARGGGHRGRRLSALSRRRPRRRGAPAGRPAGRRSRCTRSPARTPRRRPRGRRRGAAARRGRRAAGRSARMDGSSRSGGEQGEPRLRALGEALRRPRGSRR